MGDPTTWDTLPKAIDDLTTIVEQIAADILTHNTDPSAHGQSGESVYDHRTSEDLDHPDGSVSLKKISSDKNIILTCFESLDGWDQWGLNSLYIGASLIYTDGTLNDQAALLSDVTAAGLSLDFSKNPFFQTTVRFPAVTTQLAYIVAGPAEFAGAQDSFGFKVVNGLLYAYWTKSGVADTNAITGITLTDPNVLSGLL